MNFLFYQIVAIISLIHGLIHMLGFVKAMQWAPLNEIKKTITPALGWIWLLTAIILIGFSMLLFLNSSWAWVLGLLGVLCSQILIFTTWSDTKYGTLPNILIMVAVLFLVTSAHFKATFEKEVQSNLMQQTKPEVLTEKDFLSLPEPIKKYIRYTQSVSKPKLSNAKIILKGQIRKNENHPWMSFSAVQYSFFNTQKRFFYLEAEMMGLPVTGYHRFTDGHASMDIRLGGLIPIQHQDGIQMNQSELVTFFNDLCLMAPAALTDQNVKWLQTKSKAVLASYTNGSHEIKAWLLFNKEGALINFISDDRYAVSENNTFELVPWSTPIQSYKQENAYKLPFQGSGLYHYPNGKQTYIALQIESIQYNKSAIDK